MLELLDLDLKKLWTLYVNNNRAFKHVSLEQKHIIFNYVFNNCHDIDELRFQFFLSKLHLTDEQKKQVWSLDYKKWIDIDQMTEDIPIDIHNRLFIRAVKDFYKEPSYLLLQSPIKLLTKLRLTEVPEKIKSALNQSDGFRKKIQGYLLDDVASKRCNHTDVSKLLDLVNVDNNFKNELKEKLQEHKDHLIEVMDDYVQFHKFLIKLGIAKQEKNNILTECSESFSYYFRGTNGFEPDIEVEAYFIEFITMVMKAPTID